MTGLTHKRSGFAHRQVPVIDESGEAYLFPATYFVLVDLPRRTERIKREDAR
jgi:hypothetical protein